MSGARSAMTHRAEIQQNTEAGTDDYNNPLPPVWAVHSDMPCHAYTQVRKDVIDGDKIVLVEDLKALFSLNSGISEDYRIANIKDRRGAVLFPGPLDIMTLQRRGNHFEASLNKSES